MASVEMSTASTSTRESVTASQAAEGMDVLKSLLKPPEAVTATKLKPVLEKQICYFSGAKHKGLPILTFPCTGLSHLEEEEGFDDMNSSISYFLTMIKPEDVDKGVVVLVDCRKTKQAQTIKTLVEKMASHEFPLTVQLLYLLKNSTQFFSKAGIASFMKPGSRPRSLASAEVKQKLTVVSVKDKDDLYQRIPQESLTAEFGGSLEYSHLDWLASTTMYERIAQLREQILSRLPDVRDGLNEFEVPQLVKDAERLLQQHLKLKEFFVNMFAEIDVLMDQLTTRLLAKNEAAASLTVATVALLPIPSVMEYLNRTNEEVHEEQAEFDKFWAMHKARLDHIMRTCHFYRTVIKVQNLMDSHSDDLTGSEVVIGGTLEEALELGDKHDLYVNGCKDTMEKHIIELKEEGQQLSKAPTSDPAAMTPAMKKAVDEVTKKIQMLTQQQQEFMTLCQQKRDFYIVAIKFHMTVKQCDQWCNSVKELTETPPTPDTTSVEHAGTLISQTDLLMKQMTQRQLNTLKELASCLPEKQVKKITQKTTQKCTNSRLKLEDYKSKLLQLVALSYKPPQPPSQHVTDSISSVGSTSSVDHPHPSTSSLASSHSYGSLTGSDLNDAPSISPQLAGYIDDESDPAVLRNRQHVYKEIVDTETVFIEDLKIILDSYYYEMEPEERIPLRLRGKKGVIFGNLKEIYEFHSQGFLGELQLFSEHPERVGQCFLKFKSEFLLYEEYIKNRANSEALLCESPECQSFFKGIQIRLAHPLALNSFLIKPIQRITKYQLLLKDMIKHSSKAGRGLTDLKIALDLMLKLLKSINDSLHVVGLRGFPGTLAEQGRLLIHDPFQVWETTGHSRSLLSRSKERYVFLYEKVIVFSKKKEEVVQQRNREKKSDSYIYKAHLQLADVRLKDSCDDGPQVFVLSIHGENKMMYRLQAASKSVKDMWVSEVKRLLNGQFSLLKDLLLRSGTLDRETAKKYRSSNGASKAKMSDPIAIKTNGAAPAEKKSFSERFWFLKKKQRAQSNPSNSLEAPRRRSHDVAPGMRHISPSPTHQGTRLKDVMEGGASPNQSLSVTRMKAHKSTDDLHAPEGEEWSDDDDTSDHEGGPEHEFYSSLAPSVPRHYEAIADYAPSNDDQGLPLKMNQEVEVLGLNQYTGWWLVRTQDYRTGEPGTGWVPASYLRTAKDQTNMPL